MDGVVGAVRVGDVALGAVHGDFGVQAAAAADLDHVAEAHRAGRLADDAEVGDVPVLLHPWQDTDCAIGCHAFLVAGDEQADGAADGNGGKVVGGGSDEGGDAALHVAGAAAVEHPVMHLGGEGVVTPDGGADRDDVGVTGEAEMRAVAGVDAGEQVLDLAVA